MWVPPPVSFVKGQDYLEFPRDLVVGTIVSARKLFDDTRTELALLHKGSGGDSGSEMGE